MVEPLMWIVAFKQCPRVDSIYDTWEGAAAHARLRNKIFLEFDFHFIVPNLSKSRGLPRADDHHGASLVGDPAFVRWGKPG